MMDFFKEELVEARLFKSPAQFKTADASELAHNIYAHVLALNAMRYTDPGVASTYAKNTLKYNGFDGVRASATDLHNLIAGLERLEDKGTITIPHAQLKRMLKDTQNGVLNVSKDRQTIIALEKGLGIKDSNLKAMRRIIAEWPRSLPNEQKVGATRLGFMMNHYARGSDLHVPYIKSVNGIAAQNAKSPYAPLVKWGAIAGAALAGYAAIRNTNIKQAAQTDVKKLFTK